MTENANITGTMKTETPEEMYALLMSDGSTTPREIDLLILMNHYRNQAKLLREAMNNCERYAKTWGRDHLGELTKTALAATEEGKWL